MTLRNVVVVGGSIAALTAVETLRMHDFDGHITVLSDEDLPPYTRVPLSKGFLAGRDSADQVVLAPLSGEVDLHLRTPATALHTDRRAVETPMGLVPYDGLVIATGARARRIGSDDQDELVLRTFGDAQRLRAELDRVASVLIVGGGFLGMELASTAAEQGKTVTVVDLAAPLDRLLGSAAARHVARIAGEHGVRIVVEPGGVKLEGGPRPTAASTLSGRRLEADLVISAVGDTPNVEWLVGSGLPLDGGVVVDDLCRAAEHVVAAGDVAVKRRPDGTVQRIPSWTNAVEQARCAAQSLLLGGRAAPYRPSHYFWTEQFGLNIKVVGAGRPDGEPDVLAGSLATGSALLAWPDASAPRHVAAVNHHTPPVRLRRMLRAAP